MLHTLAQADPASVRADRNLELCRHQQHRQIFVDPRKPAAVDLNYVHRARLHELLEHHPVVAVLAGRDPHRGNFSANAGVSEDVVWTGWFFHPPWIYFGQFQRTPDCLLDIPSLIGIHHELVSGPNFRAHQASPTKIVGGIATDLQLEMCPAQGQSLPAERTNLVVAKANPTCRGRICRIATLLKIALALYFVGGAFLQKIECFLRRDRIRNISEVNGSDDLLWLEVCKQFPERFSLNSCIEIPDSVNEGGSRKMNDAFLGSEPAELSISGKLPGESREVGR